VDQDFYLKMFIADFNFKKDPKSCEKCVNSLVFEKCVHPLEKQQQ